MNITSLLTFTLLASAGHVMAQANVIEIINNINENLAIEWNLYITKPAVPYDIEHILKNTNKSLIIVTKVEKEVITETPQERKYLHQIFSQNLLTIIHVHDKGSQPLNGSLQIEEEGKHSLLQSFMQMASMTKISLRKLHFTHILWITEVDTLDSLYEFANICWDFGFTKVLFYNNNTLYIYDRFPQLKIRKLPSLDYYYARREIRNFHQHPLKLPITNSPPRCYRFTDRYGRRINAGYMFNILAIFMRQFNFSFSEYPHDYQDDDKIPLLKALAAGETDFTAFLIYPNRTFDASDAMWNGKVYVLTPNAKPIPKYEYFQRPFGKVVWILNCLVILVASINIAGYLYVNHNVCDFSKSYIYVFSLSFYQYQSPIHVRSWRFNLHYIMLFVYSFIMVNCYLCMLSSMLVTTIYESQINSIEGLRSTKLWLPVTQTDKDYYDRLPEADPIIRRVSTVTDGLVLDNFWRNLSTSNLHSAFEDKLLFFLYQQKYLKVPRIHLIDEVLYSVPIYFTIRPNLPYIKLYNRYLRNLWQSGVLWKTFVNMEWNGILSGQIKYFRDKETNEPLLTLEFFYSPLALYGGGIILSIVAFSGEILYSKCSREHTQRSQIKTF